MVGLNRIRALVLFSSALAAGCAAAGGLTAGATTPRMFDLAMRSAPAEQVQPGSQRLRKLQIVVDEPTAVRSLDGEMILVAMSSSEITSLAGATWSDRLPRLVQGRMIAALSESHAFKSVGGGNSKASADIVVSSELRAFQIEAVPGDDVAHVAVNVRLIEDRSGKVVGTRLFDVSRQVREKSTEASVASLSAAFADVLGEIDAWAVATLDPKGNIQKPPAAGRTPGRGGQTGARPGLVSQYDPRTR